MEHSIFDLQSPESPLRGIFFGEQKTSQGSVPPAAASTTTGQVGSEQSTKTAARSNPQVQTFSLTLSYKRTGSFAGYDMSFQCMSSGANAC